MDDGAGSWSAGERSRGNLDQQLSPDETDSTFCVALLLWYSLCVGVEWTSSAGKHGIPRDDALYAIGHAEGAKQIDGHPGEVTTVYVGHPHGQTDRYIEVIAAMRPPRTVTIFHVMPLSDLYRHLLNEGN
ncbi:hypothetical protein RI685_16470 (plasmid) [Clavibacter michiganensis]|uniref:hypothetical protein n=1 Tax=Clavibacter michiganensis TaxID=28447 RepID=UPI003DA0288B